MSVDRLPKPRPRRPPTAQISRSHEDIYDLAQEADKKAADAADRVNQLHLVTQRVEGKLDRLIKVLGSEDEDERGRRVGTGVVGRLMRVETTVAKRFSLYDGWIKMAAGFSAAVLIAAPVIWWLVSSKVAHVLK